MNYVKIDGEDTPIRFGIKTFNTLGKEYGKTLGEIFQLATDSAAKNKAVDPTDTSELSLVSEVLDMVLNLSVIALNEGARREKTGKQWTIDDVVDAVDDNVGLYAELQALFVQSLSTSVGTFTVGQSSPKNQPKVDR